MNIKPIQTSYAGCRFRSRLEARWAVFFDHIGIRWEYEKEGIEIRCVSGTQTWQWLPDFFLPETNTWVEIKGDWKSVTPEYWKMILNAFDWGRPMANSECNGLLLGDIPRPDSLSPKACFVHWSRGVHVTEGCLELLKACKPKLTEILEDDRDHADRFDACSDHEAELEKACLSIIDEYWSDFFIETGTKRALIAARSARFEHGESGAP